VRTVLGSGEDVVFVGSSTTVVLVVSISTSTSGSVLVSPHLGSSSAESAGRADFGPRIVSQDSVTWDDLSMT
jgi:hypothetical protein